MRFFSLPPNLLLSCSLFALFLTLSVKIVGKEAVENFEVRGCKVFEMLHAACLPSPFLFALCFCFPLSFCSTICNELSSGV